MTESTTPDGLPMGTDGADQINSDSKPRMTGLALLAGRIVNVLAYLFLLIILVAPEPLTGDSWISISTWYVTFMARTFQFHAGLVLGGLALLLVLVRRHRQALSLLPVVLVLVGSDAWAFVGRSFREPLSYTQIRESHPEHLRVVTSNVLFTSTTTKPLVDEILRTNADVLLIVEYEHHWHDALSVATVGDYPYRAIEPLDGAYGAAIYSRLPFVSQPILRTPASMGALSAPRVVVDFHGQPITLQALHIYPPLFGYLRFMRTQYQRLLETIPKDGHFVLGGDFNFTPKSAMHRGLLEIGLKDAMTEAGVGFAGTWPQRAESVMRPFMLPIDHIYHSSGLLPLQCDVRHAPYSDHSLIVADFVVRD